MAERKDFFLYLDLYTPIAGMSMEQKGMLLEAMFAFHAGRDCVLADPVVNMAFGFFTTSFGRVAKGTKDLGEWGL